VLPETTNKVCYVRNTNTGVKTKLQPQDGLYASLLGARTQALEQVDMQEPGVATDQQFLARGYE
jgi:hypothetical protein